MGRQVYLLATTTKKAAAVAERPWKEETEKEQQRREKNKNRSDKFVDLSKAKADQEMQASRKKNKTKLVFESGKERDSKANGYHVSGTWLKLKYSVISAKKKSLEKKPKELLSLRVLHRLSSFWLHLVAGCGR